MRMMTFTVGLNNPDSMGRVMQGIVQAPGSPTLSATYNWEADDDAFRYHLTVVYNADAPDSTRAIEAVVRHEAFLTIVHTRPVEKGASHATDA